jgi:hypothetical protein
MFILMWEQNGKTGWPKPTNTPEPSKEAVREYLQTGEGKEWQKRHPDMPWLMWVAEASATHSQAIAEITISLPSDQRTVLEKLAREWGINESAAARILISLSLHQLQ